jgi:hypothetical protein
MSQQKHTPGPWEVVALMDGQSIQTLTESRICWIWNHKEYKGKPCGSIESQDKTQEELDANARLIAAAPDLLKALEGLANCAGLTWLQGYKDELDAAMIQARAAIDKVKV